MRTFFIIVNFKGDISFVSVSAGGHTVLIDMPVTDWGSGQMAFPCGGPALPFEFDGKTIVITTSGGEKVSLQPPGEKV